MMAGSAVALAVGLAGQAQATPQTMQIAFTGYTGRSETLTNFPVLVVLSNNVGNSGFIYGNFLSANGYDLRFVTNSVATNSLNYEIESWNPNGQCLVWVQVPALPGDGSGAIWARWGNPADSNQLACTTNGATWTNAYAAVYHLATTNGSVSATDSTSINNGSVQGTVTAVNGQIDGCGQFVTSGNNEIAIPDSASLRITNKISISAWVNPTSRNIYGSLIIQKRTYNNWFFLDLCG